ncbi:hypothetical protein [Flavobacterium sp.]|jgi:hypothetical protein|uniref:hypothetical protein n=1 Tax=Flavobacterium sp. TaxID=239 RepID=UPI0037BED784
MRRVYETCGEFNLKNLTATAKTTLPDSKGLICKYVKYYNISTETNYAVFAVMVDNSGNFDLRQSPDPSIDVIVAPQPIDLQNIDHKFSRRDFKNLKATDEIYFFCWHDSTFDEGILRFLQNQEIEPSALLTAFQNENSIEENLIVRSILRPLQPKVGNGGILTVNGSC